MSKESLEQFINQVADSEELQARIGEEIDTDAFIALGTEHGCEFSAEDLAENVEISDEELDGVVGGVGQPLRMTAQQEGSQEASLRVTTTEFDMGEGGQTSHLPNRHSFKVTGLTGPIGGTLD